MSCVCGGASSHTAALTARAKKRIFEGKVRLKKGERGGLYFTPEGEQSSPGLPRRMWRAENYLLHYVHRVQRGTGWNAQNILQIKPSGSCGERVPRPLAPPSEPVFGCESCSRSFSLSASESIRCLVGGSYLVRKPTQVLCVETGPVSTFGPIIFLDLYQDYHS